MEEDDAITSIAINCISIVTWSGYICSCSIFDPSMGPAVAMPCPLTEMPTCNL